MTGRLRRVLIVSRLALTGLLLAGLAAGPGFADDSWPAVRETSLVVKPGSPLDFSEQLPNPPIDDKARIIVTPDGHLARADASTPERFLCASLGWSPASGGFPDHATADRYAEQLRLHGYNIARFHFVDASLMAGRAKDFDFDPDVLDRFRYLMAALKRNGIYWIVDGMSSPRGAFGGFDDRWDANGEMKLDVKLDDAAFAHWLRLQRELLGTVNPYTKIAPILDPALVMIVPVNEDGLEFDSIARERPGQPIYPAKLKGPFNVWLRARYGTSEALSASWGGLESGQRLEDGTIALPTRRSEQSARMRDLMVFFTDLEVKSARRMEQALRDLGFRGIIAPYNNWPTIQTSLTRAGQQAVAMNTYEDWIGSYNPGERIQGKSSFETGLAYVRAIAAARWFGKPFLVTEYDHLFWNPYRYEAGLAMPAYAGLQRWDMICRHGHGPIVLSYGEPFPHKRQMLPYAIALDPVARAGETLSALLFRRGDVRGSAVSVAFAVDPAQGLAGGPEMSSTAREPDMLTRAALVSALGLRQASTRMPGDGKTVIDVPQPRDSNSFGALVAAMRAKGVLDARNDGTLFISDTGEVALDIGSLQATVRTAKTEAIAFANLDEPVALGSVTVDHASGKGLFAVSALDGRSIAESHRLLVIFATNAQNTGMRFADVSERIIDAYGRLPVRIEPETIGVSLKGMGRWRLSPVGLDGTVYPAIASGEGKLVTRLSNDQPTGPTTYFLIERTP